jgi:hypothetical protein
VFPTPYFPFTSAVGPGTQVGSLHTVEFQLRKNAPVPFDFDSKDAVQQTNNCAQITCLCLCVLL